VASVSCPVPTPLTQSAARSALAQVRRDMPALSPAAQKRQAARVAETDQATLTSALND